jgi:hypothetical protein
MRDRDARVAGLLYLGAVLGGIFTLKYVPGKIIVPGDAVATAHNISAHELLFRLGTLGDIVMGAFWLLVVLALYQLLKAVDRQQASLMLILGAFLQVPLYFVMAAYRAAALLAATDTTSLSAFSPAQRAAVAMLFLKLHSYELNASFLFAGLWLFPFGILVYKSQVFPRAFGIWLVANGLAYLAICLTYFLAPQYTDVVGNVTQPLLFGEIAIMLWMLVMGTRTFRKQTGATVLTAE